MTLVVDPAMVQKLTRALKLGDHLYTLEDIAREMELGNLQGHVEGDTWAITQIHKYPSRIAAHIMFVVGSLENSIKLEGRIHDWARSNGASLLTAVGRNGWWQHKTPGWKIVGTMYSKDI